MEFIPYILAGIFIITTVYFFLCWRKSLQTTVEAREANIALETTQNTLHEQMKNIEALRDQVLAENSDLKDQLHTKDTQLQLVEQQNKQMHETMQDWDKVREEHLKAAKSSMLETSREMSNKLLEDHKREAQAAKEASERAVKQHTEEFFKQQKSLYEATATLSKQVKESYETSESIRQALLNPSGAGNLGEVVLETLLENSGLVAYEKYIVQPSLTGQENKRLRPDALIFLPRGNAIAIDSKSSIHFAALGQLDTHAPERKQVLAQLKTRMHTHLKDLIKRDYKDAIEQLLKDTKHYDMGGKVVTLMFLPTEEALGTLREADPTFIDTAWKSGILPVGPTGLLNHLQSSRLTIASHEQERNAKHIVDEVQKMLKNVATMHDHARKMGNNLKGALKNYDDFAGSFNTTFMARIKSLSRLGIENSKSSQLKQLERQQVHSFTGTIEGEAEENEQPALEFEKDKELA